MAVTLRAMSMVRVQGAVPEQPPPLQPVNVELADALAVNVTIAPWV